MLLKSYQPRNILILNTYGIGDCLFTTPFIRQLKNAFPEVRISYLANKRVGELFRNHPFIEKVFVYDRDDFNAFYKESKWQYWKEVRRFIQTLKDESFDMVFDFSMNGSMNFFAMATGIKHRIGLNYKNRSKFLTYAKNITGFEGQHVAQYYLDLLTELGVSAEKSPLELYVQKQDQDWAEEQFQKNNISDQRPVIGIFPGGGASWGKAAHLKRWPRANYRKLIEKCIEKFRGPIILMGDQQEDKLCSEVSSGLSDVHNFSGQTSLGQLAALLQKCDLAVVNDGGPLHMAVAVGTRTVSIFGPVDEVVYGPFADPLDHRTVTLPIACRPCYRSFRMSNCTHVSCLQKLDVSSVLKKVEELI